MIERSFITINSAPVAVMEAILHGLTNQQADSEDIKNIKGQLNDIYLHGKPSYNDILALSAVAIPIHSALSSILSISRKEVSLALRKGKITIEQFHEALVSTVTKGGVFYDENFRY